MSSKQNIRKSPSSIDAEKAVLGCMLINQKSMYKALHSLDADSFYENAHNFFSVL